MKFFIFSNPKVNLKRKQFKFSALFHTLPFARTLTWALVYFLSNTFFAYASNVSQSFTYQGRFYNSGGTAPLSDVVDLILGVYNPDGTCLLYEESQSNIDLTGTNGLFAIQVGSVLGSTRRSVGEPGLTMAQIFTNSGTQIRANAGNCPGGYTPSASDSRVLRVIVTPHSTMVPSTLVPDQLIGSQTTSLVAQTLQGLASTDFIQSAAGVAGQAGVSLASLTTLTGGSSTDASSLHNHDSLYVKLGGGGSTNLGSGIAYTTGNIGIGTAVPTADIGFGGTLPRTIQVERNSVAGAAGNNLILLAGGATSGGTDKSGGNLILSSGTSTGAGSSGIQFNTASSGPAGTTDRAPSTKMTLTADGRLGVGTQTPGAQVEIDASGSAIKGQMIKGAASQAANLLEFQTNAGSVLSYFDAAGNLTLPGDPTTSLQPATKQYVLGLIGAGTVSSFNTRTGAVILSSSDVSTALGYTPINLAGDTLTGALILAADPTASLGAATKQYVLGLVSGKQATGNYITALTGDVTAAGPGSVSATVASVGGSSAANINTAELAANSATAANTASKIVARDSSGNFSSGTISANVVGNVTGNLTGNVTGAASSNVLKAGDSMSGLLVLSADPAATLGAATKQYVDTGLGTKQNSLGYTAVNRAGDTLTGSLGLAALSTFGLGAYTLAQESTLTATLNGGDLGKTWYNSSNNVIKFWNGTSSQSLGISGAGMQTLGGLSATNQTFAIGTAGTAPLFTSATSTHTLDIPMASSGSVTAGLLSNSDYTIFLGKQPTGNYITALTGDVTGSGSGSAAATVALVGGSTAANVHLAELSANAAGSANTASTIVKRDPSGNFTAGTVTSAFIGNLAGNVTGNVTGNLTGSVTGNVAGNVTGNVTGNITGAVTGAASGNVLKAGDSMTGLLYLSAPPLDPLGAVTKKYVDDINTSLNSTITGTTSSLTLTFTSPLVNTSGNVAMLTASGSSNGLLSSTDWNTFNNKQDSLGYTPVNRAGDTVSGLLTLTSAGTSLTTLGNVGIGTTTPGTKLAVVGNVSATGTVTAATFVGAFTGNASGTATNVTGTVAVANGGTGLTSGISGGIPYFSSTGTITSSALLGQYGIVLGGGAGLAPATLSPSATSGQPLLSQGLSANPAYGTINLASSSIVTGTLPVANGGTGVVTSTGSGSLVLSNTPTLVSPILGAATGTSLALSAAGTSLTAVGNVGIGTASPEALLDVRGSIRLGVNAAQGDIVFGDYGSGLKLNGIYRGLTASTAAGNVLNLAGYDGISFDVGQAAFGNASQPSRMFISNAGNVGIGTITPGYLLDVAGTQRVTGATVHGGLVNITAAGTSLTTTGNVGIGTLSPAFTLDVAGSFRATGALTASSFSGSGSSLTNVNASNISSGTILNSYTTAVSSNTGSAIVSRDAAGNFSASTITATTFSGALTGNVTGAASFNVLKAGDTMSGILTLNASGTSLTTVGNVGIGTTIPAASLQVQGNGLFGTAFATAGGGGTQASLVQYPALTANKNTNGWPATTGTTGNAIAFRVRGGDDASLDMGVNSSGGSWLQSTNFTSYGSNYPLLLNPNGGNVGIGTTGPSYPLHVLNSANYLARFENAASWGELQVIGSGGGPVFMQSSSGIAYFGTRHATEPVYFYAGAGNRMAITSSGNVGIGTTAPGTKLHLSGGRLRIEQSDGANTSAVMELTNGTTLNYIYTDTTANSGHLVFGANTGKDIRLLTNSSTETMRITSGGNVGIGTTAPVEKLNIGGTQAALGNIAFNNVASQNSGGSTFGKITWNGFGRSTPSAQISAVTGSTGWDDTGELTFSNMNGNATLSERMRIDRAGNVGIGTSAPIGGLDINAPSGTNSWTYIRGNLNGSGTPSSSATNGIMYGWNASSGGGEGQLLYSTGSGTAPRLELGRWDGSTKAIDMTLRNGAVGIGTNNPSNALSVVRSGYSWMDITSTGGTNQGTGITLGNTNASWNMGWISNYCSGPWCGNNLRIYNASNSFSFNYDGSLTLGNGTTGTLYLGDGTISKTNGSGFQFNSTVVSNGATLTSDKRFKKDIQPLEKSLDKLLSLSGVSYLWRTDEFPEKNFSNRRQIGVIAQEIEKQFPEVVDVDSKGYRSVNYAVIVAPIIEAIKEIYNLFTGTRNEVAALKAENAALKFAYCRHFPEDSECATH